LLSSGKGGKKALITVAFILSLINLISGLILYAIGRGKVVPEAAKIPHLILGVAVVVILYFVMVRG
jgi:hypothetical protein